MSKKKSPVMYTPEGTAVYPWLNRPDTKTFNGEAPNPRYKVNLRFDPKDPKWEKFMERTEVALEEQREAYRTDPKNKRYSKQLTTKYPAFREVVDDQGDLTGELEMVVGMKASYKDKNTGEEVPMKPAFVDARNKKLAGKQVPAIFGGSTLRLAVRPMLFGTGKELTESWQLVGVQIIELAEGANSLDFGETDGFTADDDDDEDEGFGAVDTDDEDEEEEF